MQNLIYRLAAIPARLGLDKEKETSAEALINRWHQDLAGPISQQPGQPMPVLMERHAYTMRIISLSFMCLTILSIILLVTTVALTGLGENGSMVRTVVVPFFALITTALASIGIVINIRKSSVEMKLNAFTELSAEDQQSFKPSSVSKPGNIDLILALPIFLFFVYLWWGR